MHRALLLLVLGCPLHTSTAHAQRARDEARLTIGVGVLYSGGGGTLWSVGRQPVLDAAGTDTLGISRSLSGGLGLSFAGAYYPSSYYGFTGELLVARVTASDDCYHVSPGPTNYATDLCGSLSNGEVRTSSAALTAGIAIRPGLRGAAQPFARAAGGFMVMQESFAGMGGLVRRGSEYAAASVYRDEGGTFTSPYLTFGVGFSADLSPGWQGRVEVRDVWFQLPEISGPTPRQGVEPRVGTRGHHRLTFMVSVDVLLERKRGRRY